MTDRQADGGRQLGGSPVPRHSQEVDALRQQNRWYVDDNPIWIRFVPHAEVRTAAGGTKRVAQTPRAPQKVRFIPLDRQRTTDRSVQEFSSIQSEVDVRLIGDVDLQIERGDRFTVDGIEYQVLEVQPTTSAPYIKRATAFATPPDGAT